MTERPLTLDDIYELFRESERQRLEMRQAYEQERREQQQAYEQERREQQQAYEQERREQQQAYQQEQQQRQREIDEFRKIIAQTNKKMEGISDRWGEFVENLVRPAAVRLFRDQGIEIHQTALNLIAETGQMEIDILAENDREIVAIEVKSHLQARDVRRFLQTLGDFKTVFPKYQPCKLYGAVAGIKVGTRAEQEAEAGGLFVIKPGGDSVMITNGEGFIPHVW